MTELELKRKLRKEFAPPVWALLIYFLLMNGCVSIIIMLDIFIRVFFAGLRDIPFEVAMDDAMVQAMGNGWGYILTVCLGAALLLLWKKKEFCFHTIWKKQEKMQPGAFLALLCIFIGGQLVFQLFGMLLEAILNMFGLTVMDSMENASMDMDSISMLLYAGVFAPISEEILFRGLILRSLEHRGKKFAIFASAFLFGIFHGNIVQSPYAFAVGLILGYTAAEYSIWWAVILHAVNNLGLGYLLPKALGFLPQTQQEIVIFALIGVCALAGAVILLVKRKAVKQYFQAGKIHPLCLKSFFTSLPVIILTVLMVGSMLVPFCFQLLEQILGG